MPFVVDPMYQPDTSTLSPYAAMSDERIKAIGTYGSTAYEAGYSDAKLFYMFGDSCWDETVVLHRTALARIWTELLERHSYSDAAVFDAYHKWFCTGYTYVPGPGVRQDIVDAVLTPSTDAGWEQR